jgi:hypothetical protein
MRVAVLSDVHGFSLALETVVADIEATGPYDAVVVAGDHCEVGPAPREALDRLRATGWTLLKGNTDDDIVEAADRHGSHAEHFAIKQLGRIASPSSPGFPSATGSPRQGAPRRRTTCSSSMPTRTTSATRSPRR